MKTIMIPQDKQFGILGTLALLTMNDTELQDLELDPKKTRKMLSMIAFDVAVETLGSKEAVAQCTEIAIRALKESFDVQPTNIS